MTALDQPLQECGWTDANTLWDLSLEALRARDYALFDILMREIRATTRTWNPQGTGAAQEAARHNHG